MKSLNYAGNLLKLLFNNTAYAGIGDVAGLQPSGVAGNLYVSLHTDDPGTGGGQATNEATYTGYGRVGVARSGAGWTIVSNRVSNAANITFGLCTALSNTITHFGIGTDSSGAGQMLYAFPLIQTYYDATADAATDVVSAPNHALLVNDAVQLIPAPNAALPGGITSGTTYYVKTVSGDDITLSATLGGGTLDILSSAGAFIGKISTLAVSAGITPQFTSGQLAINET